MEATGDTFMKKFFVGFLITVALTSSAADILLETINFDNLDGWKINRVANKTTLESTSPKAVASMDFETTSPGAYYLYAEVFTLGQHYRKTDIFVNRMKYLSAGDEEVKNLKYPAWHWIKSPAIINLKAGKNSIKIQSKNAFARIRCIVLSTNPQFAPPEETVIKEVYSREKEGIFPCPKPTGNGPDMLLLNGGRPWEGNASAQIFAHGGYRVKILNSVYLAGLGGASIKITPDNRTPEPEALDGITPEFKRLNKYKIIVVNNIPLKMQTKLFTPERIAVLKKFIADGGKLILTINAPISLDELLPFEVIPDSDEFVELENAFTKNPGIEAFKAMMDKWRILHKFRMVKPKKGSKTLCEIFTEDGFTTKVPYIVTMKYGKGEVLFWNSQYERVQKAQQLLNWAYTPALMNCLAASICPDKNVNTQKLIQPPKRESEPVVLEKASAKIVSPKMELQKEVDSAVVSGNTIKFGTTAKIIVKNNTVDVYFGNASKPYIADMTFPQIYLPKGATKVNDNSSAEAVGMTSEDFNANVKWQVKNISAKDNTATITLVSADGAHCKWNFVSGKLHIDGRDFYGIGQKTHLLKSPYSLIESIRIAEKLDVSNRIFRRFACYQPPRGYKEHDFSGAVSDNTRHWGFFGDGQPFSWLQGKDAVFTEFAAAPFPVSVDYNVKKGQSFANGNICFRFGRVPAPQETIFFWQMVTSPEYNTDNDWIAMYQFQRKYLRKTAGFPEIPARPCANNSNTCSAAERLKIIKAAKQLGFTQKKVGVAPWSMETFETAQALRYFAECQQEGIVAYPWFPCFHSPGETWTVKKHPQWYISDENGKPFKYFGHFYVADVNNPDFRKWHLQVVDKMFDNGVKVVWYDMAGAASGRVNFGTPQSPTAFWQQMEVFRHFYRKGGWVVSEGMNPLVLDGYIFRENIYHEPVGNEFAMIGAIIEAAGWRCDRFRLAMYGIFTPEELDPLVLDFEYKLGDIANLKKITAMVPTINRLLDQGMPFIRNTEFGTTWISDNGGALFFWNGVKNFEAELPRDLVTDTMLHGGQETKLNGKMPTGIQPETIITLKKIK